MKQYEMYEMKFKGEIPEGSYAQVDLTANFMKDGKTVTAKGFYAGDGNYIIRFLPREGGIYTYQVNGFVEASGELVCEPADKKHHGLVRAVGTHFQYEDGSWYYPFGTTVYALVHQEKALIEQTMETLSQAPFNKIRICVFPKHYPYNNNEPEFFPFEKKGEGWDVHRPVATFWDHLEMRILQLESMGIECDLILFHAYDHWGFAKLSREEALVYLDYVMRRFSAFPNIWWSLANEYELLKYTKEDWEIFAHFVQENDGYGHLLSNHQIFEEWDFSNPDTTHICVQIANVDEVYKKISQYQKPMMVDECRYEGNLPLDWGNLSGFEMTNRFWKVCTQGAYCTHGETFLNEEEILWWSKGGTLIGESPARIRFLREIIESLPGPLVYGKPVMTLERARDMMENPPEEMKNNPFYLFLKLMPLESVMSFIAGSPEYIGQCGEEAFLKYFERNCPAIGMLELPKDGSYEIEVIDAWEMTRSKACEGVNGHVEIKLLGKEGIAILARRTS